MKTVHTSHLPPVLSTWPLHASSGYGKREARIDWPMVVQRQHPLLEHYLKNYWPCAGRLSAANAIGTQLRDPINAGLFLLLLFFTFSVLAANPKKTILHGGQSRSWSAEQAKENKRKTSGSCPPPYPPRCSFGEKKKKSRDAFTGATQDSVHPASGQGFCRLVDWVIGCCFAKFYASVCDNKFPSVVTSLSSWRCLAVSTSYFLRTAMNLRTPSVTVSIHTSAFNAVVFQSSAMPNARISLCMQSVHSFSFPPRPLRTAHSRFPNTIRFGSRPPLIRMSIPAHKCLLVRNVVSMFSYHEAISRARLYEVI